MWRYFFSNSKRKKIICKNSCICSCKSTQPNLVSELGIDRLVEVLYFYLGCIRRWSSNYRNLFFYLWLGIGKIMWLWWAGSYTTSELHLKVNCIDWKWIVGYTACWSKISLHLSTIHLYIYFHHFRNPQFIFSLQFYLVYNSFVHDSGLYVVLLLKKI